MTNIDTDAVRAAWRPLRGEIEGLFGTLWSTPEMPGLEHRSMAVLADWLEAYGFAVERGIGGLPTAFAARRGSGRPRVGILAEYDALACLDNDAVPYRTGTGRRPGHGCGHNHIGPANSGAAIAAALAAERLGIAGEIVLIGCPAEEIGWGKLALLDAGVFDGLDVVLTSHGDYQNGSLSRPCHAVCSGEFVFLGESAHGGKSASRNALAAAEQALSSFRDLVELRFPEAQLKHVYRTGGVMPGVVPDEVRLWCSVRHSDYGRMLEIYAVMTDHLSKVAERKGVGFREQFVAACRGYLPNHVVGRVLQSALECIGPPAWSDADLAWMSELSKACSPGEPFSLHQELEFFDSGIDYYGQDDGDLSWHIPLGRINWAYPTNVPIHHWAWTALSGHAASSPGPLMASQALALSAVRLLRDDELIRAAKHELEARTAEQVIGPPLTGITKVMTQDPASFWDASWTSGEALGTWTSSAAHLEVHHY